jgi:hypothetical protein
MPLHEAVSGVRCRPVSSLAVHSMQSDTSRQTLDGRVDSLRHAFAVRALHTCPDGRDAITQHMVELSTDLGHAKVADTYWYLEASRS